MIVILGKRELQRVGCVGQDDDGKKDDLDDFQKPGKRKDSTK